MYLHLPGPDDMAISPLEPDHAQIFQVALGNRLIYAEAGDVEGIANADIFLGDLLEISDNKFFACSLVIPADFAIARYVKGNASNIGDIGEELVRLLHLKFGAVRCRATRAFVCYSNRFPQRGEMGANFLDFLYYISAYK